MVSIATWNINSVRLRLPIVERFLKEEAPDVLCLQEIKCQEHQFPTQALADAGYGEVEYGKRGGVSYRAITPLP